MNPNVNLVDIFSGDAFSTVEMTAAIRSIPTQYGLLNEMGLFSPKGIATTVAALEQENGVLNLIPSTQRGTPGVKNKAGKRKMRFFELPRLLLEDKILPSDIQNVREFGGTELKTAISETNDRLVKMSRKHDITHEFLKCGAVSGKIMDASGAVLLDLFEEFEIVEKVKGIDMDSEDSKIRTHLNQISRHIETALCGDRHKGILSICSPEYFDALLENADLKQAHQNYMDAREKSLAYAGAGANPLRDNVRNGFLFDGFYFLEYAGKATSINSAGETVEHKFIEDGEARFLPMGTTETFFEFQGPADWMETVNTVGVPKYAKVVPEQGGRYVEVLTESDNLPICARPDVLVRGTLNPADSNLVE